MIEDMQLLKFQGCSDVFIEIMEKYSRLSTDIDDLESFVSELELYKAGETIHPFEQNVLDLAKEKLVSLLTSPVSGLANDDSTERAIKINEMDYNGDVFETMGYEMSTDDGRRY